MRGAHDFGARDLVHAGECVSAGRGAARGRCPLQPMRPDNVDPKEPLRYAPHPAFYEEQSENRGSEGQRSVIKRPQMDANTSEGATFKAE